MFGAVHKIIIMQAVCCSFSVLLTGPFCQLSSRTCSEAVYRPIWHTPLLSVQRKDCRWWTDGLSETCRVPCQIKFVKLVHLVGFIAKKYVTMRGHVNVKKLHNHPINSLYTAYLLSQRDKKFKPHRVTHCDIHRQTKYQHTKPYNVYDHTNENLVFCSYLIGAIISFYHAGLELRLFHDVLRCTEQKLENRNSN